MTPEEMMKLLSEATGPLDIMTTLAHMQRVYFNELVKDGFSEGEAMMLLATTTESVLNAVALAVRPNR